MYTKSYLRLPPIVPQLKRQLRATNLMGGLQKHRNAKQERETGTREHRGTRKKCRKGTRERETKEKSRNAGTQWSTGTGAHLWFYFFTQIN